MTSRSDAIAEAREHLECARRLIRSRVVRSFDDAQANIGSARVLIDHARQNGVDVGDVHSELRAVERMIDAWIAELAKGPGV